MANRLFQAPPLVVGSPRAALARRRSRYALSALNASSVIAPRGARRKAVTARLRAQRGLNQCSPRAFDALRLTQSERDMPLLSQSWFRSAFTHVALGTLMSVTQSRGGAGEPRGGSPLAGASTKKAGM